MEQDHDDPAEQAPVGDGEQSDPDSRYTQSRRFSMVAQGPPERARQVFESRSA